MELSIPAYSVKEFTAILKSFKSFSDFLHIHPHPSRLKFSAVSPTRSTYAVAIFEKAYFESYTLSNPTLGLIEIAAKPLHKIFAQSNLIAALESCNISIDSGHVNDLLSLNRSTAGSALETQSAIHRLVVKLKSTVGITRSFVLPYSNSRTLNPTDLRCDNSPNRWVCLSSHLKQWIDHFVVNPNITQNLVGSVEGVEDICFCYQSDQQITLKTLNLADGSNINAIVPKKQDIFTKGVRQLATSLTINSAEFETFEVDTTKGTIITAMSIKEVRSIFELGTVLGCAIDVGFSVGGRPVYFSITNEEGSIGVEFVLASTDGEELGVLDPKQTNLPREARDRQAQAKGNNHRIRDSPISSRVDSPGQSNNTSNEINPVARVRESVARPLNCADNMPRPQQLFRQTEGSNEVGYEEDELDHIPADQWAQVEQEAIALSQTRKRTRLNHSQPAILANDDDDDEQLLPSQNPRNDQPHWKLFFD